MGRAPVRGRYIGRMHTSPLDDRHRELGAKFSEFGGWQMPLEYQGAGVLAEHRSVRSSVGLFDVSHLGKVAITGPGAAEFLNRCFTNDLTKIGPGQAQYTFCCDESGGTIDDMLVYVRSADDVLAMPNAANSAEVIARLDAAAPDGINIIDLHHEYAVLAVQGPASDDVMTQLGLPIEHPYMTFVEASLDERSMIVCRSGYTGERGCELLVNTGDAHYMWDRLMEAGAAHGIQPCGLGARDTLRTEMGLSLHGHELSTEITPVMARSGWAIGWNKEEFWGKKALEAQREAKNCRLIRGIRAAGRAIPRAGMTVRDGDGADVGVVTSGTFSPSLEYGIGLVLVDRDITYDDQVQIDVRRRQETFDVVKPPFVTPVSNPTA